VVTEQELAAHRALFEEFAAKNNFQGLDDWNQITLRDLPQKLQNILRSSYGWSLQNALSVMYPWHKWLEWNIFSTIDERRAHFANKLLSEAQDSQVEYFSLSENVMDIELEILLILLLQQKNQ
jgi:hypothetical protein